MKKATLAICALAVIMTATSCKKNSPNPGGSWTLNGTTYNVAGSSTAGGLLTFVDQNDNDISLDFGGSLPTTGGSYTVIDDLPGPNQVFITFSSNTTYYNATGGNGTNQHVTVSVSGGKVSVSGKGMVMKNVTTTSATDSATFTLHVTQL